MDVITLDSTPLKAIHLVDGESRNFCASPEYQALLALKQENQQLLLATEQAALGHQVGVWVCGRGGEETRRVVCV